MEQLLSGVLAQLIGGILSGLIGFASAYKLWQITHKSDLEQSVHQETLRKINAVRVPLRIILGEITNEYQLNAYFNSNSESSILNQIGEAVYSIGDQNLSEFFEKSKRYLHEFASLSSSSDRKSRAPDVIGHINRLLKRLDELEKGEVRHEAGSENRH